MASTSQPSLKDALEAKQAGELERAAAVLREILSRPIAPGPRDDDALRDKEQALLELGRIHRDQQ